jgi:hypothetical protein
MVCLSDGAGGANARGKQRGYETVLHSWTEGRLEGKRGPSVLTQWLDAMCQIRKHLGGSVGNRNRGTGIKPQRSLHTPDKNQALSQGLGRGLAYISHFRDEQTGLGALGLQ